MTVSDRLALIPLAAGAELRRLRLSAGLSQAQVAVYCDSHRPIIGRVESGRHCPSIEVCAVHAAVCGGSLADVFLAIDRAVGLLPPVTGGAPAVSPRSRSPRVFARAPRAPGAPSLS